MPPVPDDDSPPPKLTAQMPGASDAPAELSERLKEIFDAASELTGEPRARLLERECGSDAHLRHDVEELLAAHDLAGGFLADPAGAVAAATAAASGDDEPPVDPNVGQTIGGRYAVIEKIGEGGFGTVYQAEQRWPVRRTVALKIIKPGMDSKQVIARFQAERQALAMMDHPNIARVLDAGTTDAGRPFFVMELVRGVPITEYCDAQHLTVARRLELFVRVCEAVQHAHQKGIIHRDLKPSNVLVAIYGDGGGDGHGEPVPKVIDFGVAKALHEKLSDVTLFTQAGVVVGTLQYMSPEQAQMDAMGTDTRSDIYSLGVMLYELLAGSTPLDGRALREAGQHGQVARLIQETEPPTPSTRIGRSGEEALSAICAQRDADPKKLSTMLAGDLDWIVMRCLEKDRARRYQTANGLARDLQRYLADEPVEARPPSATYRFRKYARKHRTTIQVGAAAVLFLLAITIGSSIAALKFIRQRNAARELTRRAVAAEGRANDEQLKSTISQARSALTSLRAGRRFESLASLTSAARISSSVDVRSGAIACMALADLRPLQHWVTSQELGGVFSHDLTIHGVVTTGGEVVFERVPARPGATPDRPPFLRFPIARAIDIRYSPDDRLIAILDADNHVYLCNVEGRRLGEFAGTACNFLPDNESLGVITADGELVIYDVRTCVERRRMPWVTATRMEFSPDGRRLATLFPNQSPIVYVGEIAENGARPVRVVHPGLAFRASWHPGGTLLATCGNHDDVLVWNVASLDRIGPPAAVFKGHQSAVTDVAFSHGGDLAASASWDGTVRLWSVATGEPLVRLFWSAADLRFSADDRRLACECVWTCSMLEVSPGRECRTLVAPTEMGDKCAAFSPDGSLLACNGGSIVRVWNTSDWTVAADIEGMGASNALQFQLDGKALIARTWEGVWRVPVSCPPPTDARTHPAPVIGPKPERIVAVEGGGHFDLAPDRVHAAVACQDAIMLVDLREAGAPVTLMRGAGAACAISISPDGNWIASGTWKEVADRRARIWDARDGKLVTHLPTGELEQNVAFSPDGRWLVTSSVYDYRFWSVRDWALHHTIARAASQAAGRICFSPDSRIVAISHRSKGVRLIEPDSGAELATLEDEGEQVPLSFSPDGNLLVTQGQNDTLRVWDLSLITRQLGEMGLNCPLTPRALVQRETRPAR